MRISISSSGNAGTHQRENVALFIDSRTGYIIEPSDESDVKINAQDYWLFPALINTHDHLELNHYPRTRFRERYDNAHQWGEDVSQHLDRPPFAQLRQYALWEQCWLGGMKNLLSGVASVAHHNPLHRSLRQKNFPVYVLQNYTWAHSLHFTDHVEIKRQIERASAQKPFMIHLAEGDDHIAAAEYHQLERLGGIGANTIIIHGVGLKPTDQEDAIQKGASLIWCPSSNIFLLGKTASIEKWRQAKRIGIGSDSRLTADGDLLDELRAAKNITEVSAIDLFHMVTDWAAAILGLSQRGSLAVGKIADVIAVRRKSDNPYDDLVFARRVDIGLVIRAGKALYGDHKLIEQWPTDKYLSVNVDGKRKYLLASIGKRFRRCRLQEQGLQFD